MTVDNFAIDELTRYLLGEMSEEDQTQLELRCFGDPQLFAELCAFRDKLIDGYVTGGLSPTMRQRFETGIENSWAMNERIRFAETLQEAIAARRDGFVSESPRPNVRTRGLVALARRYRRPLFATAILAITLGAGWLFIRNRRQRDMEAGLQTPSPLATDETATSPNQSGSPVNGSVTPSPPTTLYNPMLTVALTSDLGSNATDVRADVLIPQNTIIVKLLLMVEQTPDVDYGVVVQTPAGADVFKTDHLKPHANDLGKSVELFVPASRLPDGDYVIRVSGVTADNEMINAGNYYLHIRKS